MPLSAIQVGIDMFKSILLKEYCKIRKAWLAAFCINTIVIGYLCIETRQLFFMTKPEVVWYEVIHLGQIYYGLFKYVPVFLGIFIACVQFFPEMRDERLRLTLHLPASPHGLILTHILIGVIALGALIIPDCLSLFLISRFYFPPEASLNLLLTILPWGCAGLAAYIGTAASLLEPGIRLRILNGAITAGLTGVFLFPAEPGGYCRILLFLLLPLLLMVPSVLLPAYHFRFRRVS